jgi:hypothetical protein
MGKRKEGIWMMTPCNLKDLYGDTSRMWEAVKVISICTNSSSYAVNVPSFSHVFYIQWNYERDW